MAKNQTLQPKQDLRLSIKPALIILVAFIGLIAFRLLYPWNSSEHDKVLITSDLKTAHGIFQKYYSEETGNLENRFNEDLSSANLNFDPSFYETVIPLPKNEYDPVIRLKREKAELYGAFGIASDGTITDIFAPTDQ